MTQAIIYGLTREDCEQLKSNLERSGQGKPTAPLIVHASPRLNPDILAKGILEVFAKWYAETQILAEKETKKRFEEFIKRNVTIKVEFAGTDEKGQYRYFVTIEGNSKWWIDYCTTREEANRIFEETRYIKDRKIDEIKRSYIVLHNPEIMARAISSELGENYEVSYSYAGVDIKTGLQVYEFAMKKKGAVEEKKAEEKAAPQVPAAVEVSTPTVTEAKVSTGTAKVPGREEYLTIDGAKEEINEWMKTAIKKSSTKQFECVDEDTAKEALNFVEGMYSKHIKNGTLTAKHDGATVILTTKVAKSKEEKKPKKEEVKKTEEKKKIVPYSYEYYLGLFKGTDVDKEMEKVKAEKRTELAKKIYDYLPKGFENYSPEEKGKYINYLKTLIPAWVDALNSE